MKKLLLVFGVLCCLLGDVRGETTNNVPASSPYFSEAQRAVIQAYKDVLRRNPDPKGLADYVDALVNQGRDTEWLYRSLRTSEEGKGIGAIIRRERRQRAMRAGIVLLALVFLGLFVSRRHLWKQALLVLFGCALLFVVLELGLRIIRFTPASDALARSDRSDVFYRMDRERLHPFEAGTAGVFRIAVIGDSFAHGEGVQVDDRFAAKLERMLNANAGVRPACVDVYARCGTSTYQQMPLLEKALEEEPDLVVLSVCLNDTENRRNPLQLRAWRLEMQPAAPSGIWTVLVRVSHLFGLIHYKLEHHKARKGYFRYYKRLYDPAYDGWRYFTNAIVSMRNACAEHDTPFLVLIHPLLTEPFKEGMYPFEFVHDAIHAHLDAERIPYVDVLPRVRNAMSVRMTAIPSIDPHPSEIAHRIVAETLFDFVLEKGYVGPEYALRWRAASERTLSERWKETGARMNALSAADRK